MRYDGRRKPPQSSAEWKRERTSVRLYDPQTADTIRAEQVPGRLVVLGIASVVCGIVIAAGHHEWPFLAYWSGYCSPADFAYACTSRVFFDVVAGVGSAVVAGALSVAGHRYGPIPPTITCRACGTSGWVLDIEPMLGRCPTCGGERFDYRTWFGSANGLGPVLERVEEHDVAGADLVERFRATRNSSMRRYY